MTMEYGYMVRIVVAYRDFPTEVEVNWTISRFPISLMRVGNHLGYQRPTGVRR